MKLIKICLLVLLVGCGRGSYDFVEAEKLPTTRHIIDARLIDYVEAFKAEFEVIEMDITIETKLKDYRIKGEFLNENVAGVCWKSLDGTQRKIEIKQSLFDTFTEGQREELIFHELAHCTLDKIHNDERFNAGCPKSIMNSYIFNTDEIENCYEPHKNYYIDELAK